MLKKIEILSLFSRQCNCNRLSFQRRIFFTFGSTKKDRLKDFRNRITIIFDLYFADFYLLHYSDFFQIQ